MGGSGVAGCPWSAWGTGGIAWRCPWGDGSGARSSGGRSSTFSRSATNWL